MACTHVDDIRYAGDASAKEIWAALQETKCFGRLAEVLWALREAGPQHL